MRLVCPSCGASHSIEGWQNDAAARQCMRMIFDMPPACSKYMLAYLALFRPGTGRGLPWNKCQVLTQGLLAVIGMSHIQIGHKPARPVNIAIWSEALARITDQPPQRLPLKSHGYLLAICYDIANDTDRHTEVERNKLERTGQSVRRDAKSCVSTDGEPERISFAEFKRRNGLNPGVSKLADLIGKKL